MNVWQHYYKVQTENASGKPAGSEELKRVFMIENYFLKLCLVFKIKKILDVGCAFGSAAKYMMERKFDVRGININKREVEAGNKKLFKGKKIIKYGDMHDIPFDNGTFDAIYCSHTLEHSIAPYVALCEFNRVLKNKGLVFIQVPEEGNYWTSCHFHYFCPTVRQLAGLLHKTGFSSIRQWRSEWTFSPIEVKRDLNFIWQKQMDWQSKKDDKMDFMPDDARKMFIKNGLIRETEINLHKSPVETNMRKKNKRLHDLFENMKIPGL